MSMTRNAHTILTPIPLRKAGQKDVLGLTTPPMETVRLAIVGLGIRGQQAVKRISRIPGARISVLCDTDPSREVSVPGAVRLTDWKEACRHADVDLVYICTDWAHHVPVALEAMENGKHVAVEVPAAQTMEQIWALIDKAEETRRHCMMLENAAYDDFEQTTLAMARAGVFGEIVHVEGAYHHRVDFNKELWRLDYNRTHRGDIYPTHGLGPVCQILDLHRRDRLEMLVSVDSAALTGTQLTGDAGFANADQTSTLLKTRMGRTILLEHNIMTPRPYSRMYQVVGTQGYAAKYPVPQVCLLSGGEEVIYQGEQLRQLQAPYRNWQLPLELQADAQETDTHGGMDFLMDYRLIQALRKGEPLDMDVYDLAEWCCVAPLSRLSLDNGSAPVAVPDFTRQSINN